MGVETVIAGSLIGGGLMGQRKAEKNARRAADEQAASLQAQQNEMRANAARVDAENRKMGESLQRKRSQLEAGSVRAARGRISGGIFGDSDATQQPLTRRLGT